MSADIIYCEEMAFMDLSVVYEVVMPLMEMEYAALIGISSPVDNYNFFHRLFKLKNPDTGENLINTYIVQLVCDMCKKKATGSENCTHLNRYVPPWKSVEKFNLIKMIFGESNRETLMRESRGVPTDGGDSLITTSQISSLKTKIWKCNPLLPARRVILFCDPNAGGMNHMALCSVAFEDGKTIVCYIFF